ncbi:unnamed protein product [Vitrella brassicaformis CCMP3155]|uniref:Importin N-terminal domain-containing protein n=5 Tax=Vitrella brassicaformis TaxID=1169539 RepID=A0A0G4F777_VITBC|nr:unnamed protein product [Vitrella brassicaformis CCMP3155]|eukprot:CEM08566.1 unnamed protein product [Vitrella brassicaformis CCMP3155]
MMEGTADQRAMLIQTLNASIQQDGNIRKPAEQELQRLEGMAGLALVLFHIYADGSVDPKSRWLAIVLCKNVIYRNWQNRHAPSHQLQDGEKQQLKQSIVTILQEPPPTAAGGLQNGQKGSVTHLPHIVELSLIIRRICRFEFPSKWPQLGQLLIAKLNECDSSEISDEHCVYIALLHGVLKEQGSKRLIMSRRESFQLGPPLVECVGRVWMRQNEALQQAGEASLTNLPDGVWKASRYLDGLMYLVLTHCFEKLHDHAAGGQLALLMYQKLLLLIRVWKHRPAILASQQWFFKNVKSALKWMCYLVEGQCYVVAAINVGDLLRTALELVQFCRVTQPDVPDHLVRHILILIGNIFSCHSYRFPPAERSQLSEAGMAAAAKCKEQLQAFLQANGGPAQIGEAILDRCLVLNAHEASEYLDEPEEGIREAHGTSETRNAAERALTNIANAPFDESVVSHVVQRLRGDLLQADLSGRDESVLFRMDALLCWTGLLEAKLQAMGKISFRDLIQLVLQLLPRQPHPLIQTRLANLIKVWLSEATPSPAPMDESTLGTTLDIIAALAQAITPQHAPQTPQQAPSPAATAVALASLAPLRLLLVAYPLDNYEAWVQGDRQKLFVSTGLNLLRLVRSPEAQWRCLAVIQKLLSEASITGRTDLSKAHFDQFLALWRQQQQQQTPHDHHPSSVGDPHSQADMQAMIRPAIVDVLKSLVTMACPSKDSPTLLSDELLATCLQVVSDGLLGGSRSSLMSSTVKPPPSSIPTQAALSTTNPPVDGSSALDESCAQLLLAVTRVVQDHQVSSLKGVFTRLVQQHLSERPFTGSLLETVLDVWIELSLIDVLAFLSHRCQVTPQPSALEELPGVFGSLLDVCTHILAHAREEPYEERVYRLLQLLVMALPMLPSPSQTQQQQQQKLHLCVLSLYQHFIKAAIQAGTSPTPTPMPSPHPPTQTPTPLLNGSTVRPPPPLQPPRRSGDDRERVVAGLKVGGIARGERRYAALVPLFVTWSQSCSTEYGEALGAMEFSRLEVAAVLLACFRLFQRPTLLRCGKLQLILSTLLSAHHQHHQHHPHQHHQQHLAPTHHPAPSTFLCPSSPPHLWLALLQELLACCATMLEQRDANRAKDSQQSNIMNFLRNAMESRRQGGFSTSRLPRSVRQQRGTRAGLVGQADGQGGVMAQILTSDDDAPALQAFFRRLAEFLKALLSSGQHQQHQHQVLPSCQDFQALLDAHATPQVKQALSASGLA